MRTTLDLDDRVLAVARAMARDTGISLGAAVSELARQGLARRPVAHVTGFPMFDEVPDAAPITLEIVNEHRDADH